MSADEVWALMKAEKFVRRWNASLPELKLTRKEAGAPVYMESQGGVVT